MELERELESGKAKDAAASVGKQRDGFTTALGVIAATL